MALSFRKTLIRVLGGVLALVAILLIVRTVFDLTSEKKLGTYLATLKPRGIPLARSEILEPCGEAGNGFRFWKAAESLLILNRQDAAILTKAYDDMLQGRAFVEETRRGLEALLLKDRPALDMAAQAASKPCWRSASWDPANTAFTEGTGVAMIRLTNLLAFDAVLRADGGDLEGALAECRLGLTLAWRLMDEPSLIFALISLADAKFMVLALDRIFPGRELDSLTLRTWIKELDPVPWRNRLARSRPAERIMSLKYGPALLGDPVPEEIEDQLREVFPSRFSLWLRRPLIRQQLIKLQRFYDDLMKIVPLPYYAQEEFFKRYASGLSRAPWYMGGIDFTMLRLPNIETSFFKEATLEALMLATRAGLAARLFAKESGRLPSALADLVPAYLPDTPLDPFTGKPLAFSSANGEILVYSLGSNKKDDGGRMTYKITRMIMPKDDDWTWRDKID